jgi:hypothetical protein
MADFSSKLKEIAVRGWPLAPGLVATWDACAGVGCCRSRTRPVAPTGSGNAGGPRPQPVAS